MCIQVLSGVHGLMSHPCRVPMLHTLCTYIISLNLGLQAVTPFMAFSHPGEEVICQVLAIVLVNICLSSDLSASIDWLLASSYVRASVHWLHNQQLQCLDHSSYLAQGSLSALIGCNLLTVATMHASGPK